MTRPLEHRGKGDTPSQRETSNSERREFRVRVQAEGYAIVKATTKAEAVRNARAGDFARTPRPEWYAFVSDVTELEPR